MIDEPQIVQTALQQAAIIHVTIPRAQIRDAMRHGKSELIATVAAQGIPAGGPWFTHHLAMYPDTFDFEIGLPVTGQVTPAGRMQPGQLLASTVARTIHHGDYEGLGDTWAEFDAWISAHRHTPRGDLWEVYLVGPESDPDPAKWRTELNRPLADKR
jgi:effector-binding domain-containing protein